MTSKHWWAQVVCEKAGTDVVKGRTRWTNAMNAQGSKAGSKAVVNFVLHNVEQGWYEVGDSPGFKGAAESRPALDKCGGAGEWHRDGG